LTALRDDAVTVEPIVNIFVTILLPVNVENPMEPVVMFAALIVESRSVEPDTDDTTRVD
jgi:hypothetical protein